MSRLSRIILGYLVSFLFIVIPAKAQKEAEVYNVEITVDRTMAGYKEFSEHFMTEKYSISTAARKKDGAWNLELVFDVSILELFAEDGVDAISTVVYPETPYDRISWKGDLSVELYEIDA